MGVFLDVLSVLNVFAHWKNWIVGNLLHVERLAGSWLQFSLYVQTTFFMCISSLCALCFFIKKENIHSVVPSTPFNIREEEQIILSLVLVLENVIFQQ